MKTTLTQQTAPTTSSSATLWAAAVLWLAVIIAIMVWIAVYSNSPGHAESTPVNWPSHSGIKPVTGRPTLILFAHPRCPCTRASLGELARLLVQDHGLGNVSVLFINPPGMPTDWARTDLWRQATLIPGVTVEVDQDGVEAKRFGVETSGMTILYDSSGLLLFAGGITISRGHSGDNPGQYALLERLTRRQSELAQSPVFGCPLFVENCGKGALACKP